jgi:hypothetical protein
MTMLKARVILASLLLVLITSCSRKAPPPKVDRLKWNQSTLVDYYNEHGQKNAAWDADAKSALSVYAQVRTGSIGGLPELTSAASAAVSAGCTDPMVEYLRCRFAPPADQPSLIRDYIKAADDLQASGYDPAHKFYGNVKAATAIGQIGAKDPNFWKANLNSFKRLEKNAQDDLLQTIGNTTLSPVEVQERCQEYVQFVSAHRRNGLDGIY